MDIILYDVPNKNNIHDNDPSKNVHFVGNNFDCSGTRSRVGRVSCLDIGSWRKLADAVKTSAVAYRMTFTYNHVSRSVGGRTHRRRPYGLDADGRNPIRTDANLSIIQ